MLHSIRGYSRESPDDKPDSGVSWSKWCWLKHNLAVSLPVLFEDSEEVETNWSQLEGLVLLHVAGVKVNSSSTHSMKLRRDVTRCMSQNKISISRMSRMSSKACFNSCAVVPFRETIRGHLYLTFQDARGISPIMMVSKIHRHVGGS